MTEYALPLDRFSAKVHIDALRGLVDRYEHEQEPIHYKKASTAIDASETTCSSCLRYLKEINLIKAEKQGVYVPSEPILDRFTKVGKAKEKAVEEILSKLSQDPVYDEIIFHLHEDGVEKSELAKKVAGGLEINKDKISQVEKSIEIFAELEALNIDEGGVVSTKNNPSIDSVDGDSEQKEADPEPETSSNRPAMRSIDPNQIDTTDLELPPTSGDPESLHTLCSHLRKGGKRSLSEIADETEFAKRTARGHARYGEELGFLQKTEDGITLTERGYELGFQSGLNEETQDHFLDGLLQSKFYLLLLYRCLENVVEKTNDNTVINTSEIEKELRTHFAFTEERERTLRGAISAFFQTIEASGFGNYVIGRGGQETRLEISTTELEELDQIILGGSAEPESQEESPEEGETEEGDKSDEDEIREEDGSKQDGPPLRISSFRIQNFRNIQDSGKVRLENITTFIGKNEGGKTSTLEAIDSFNNDYLYHINDICNDINHDYDMGRGSGQDLPIITLTFEITEEVLERFYPDYEPDQELPITYEVTKYADGHLEENSDLGISPPSPDIVYYNEYEIISDTLYFEKDPEDQNQTFKNLLRVGELDEVEIISTSGLEHHQAIEEAENLIESRLNEAWSQKDIRINLRYEKSENCLHLFLQDDLEEQERTLTQPSQRSEGFQWFFSFYANLIAETSGERKGYKILLLDDPAVHLHPSGKQDWLNTLEEVAQEEQVLYTSHSPYLIEKQYPSRIRTVQDTSNGTQISADIFDADSGTLEPLRNALGINLSSSPFVSEGQVLVEGPTEYYILTAVGAYFEDVLDRGFINWNQISIMPVRGANDTIGKASWLASEDVEYVILMDSDEKGRSVQSDISKHHHDIDNERVLLLERGSNENDVVLEDLFAPGFYVNTFNEFYADFTTEFSHDFEPVTVESDGHNSWEIGVTEYNGTRIDQALVAELERQDVADELRNDDGEIELLKRQIAEVIADKINNGNVVEEDLEFFNPVLARIDNSMDL